MRSIPWSEIPARRKKVDESETRKTDVIKISIQFRFKPTQKIYDNLTIFFSVLDEG